MHCCFGNHTFVKSEEGLWSSSQWENGQLENTQYNVLTRKRLERHSPNQYRKRMHLQQKALTLQYFFIPKRCVLSHVCNPSVWYFLKCLPLYDLYTTLYLWHSVSPLLGCWMLCCTVCRTVLMKLRCLTWLIPLPYWEVFFVCCNVLWPIGVVAQNKT